jgi:hypothetical protein
MIDDIAAFDLDISGTETCRKPCAEVTELAKSVAEIKRSNTLAQVAIGAIVSIALGAISYHTSTQIAQIQQGASHSELDKISKQLEAISSRFPGRVP